MKKTLFLSFLLFSICNQIAKAQDVFRTYQGKFTMSTNGEIAADNFTLSVRKNVITYEKGGNLKTFDAIDQGVYIREPQPGVKFKYHKFYLTNQKMYLIISYNKEIKHNGVFYYRLTIDGQTQLAL